MTAGSESRRWVLRLFAGSWAAICFAGAWLAWQWLPAVPLWIVPAGMGLLLAGGLAFPEAMQRPYRLVEIVLAPLGKVVSLFMLALVYGAVFSPFALVLRLLGWDPLRLRRRAGVASAWVERPRQADKPDYHWQY